MCRCTIFSFVMWQARRMDRSLNHPVDGILVVIEVVRIAAAVGQHQPRRVSPARTPGALGIVERFRRHIAEKNRVQVAEIDANLERGGRAEKMNVAVLEAVLPLPGLFGVDLCGVFFRACSVGGNPGLS